MIKINGMAIINTVDGRRLSYTISEINENGEIIKSNIRKSVAIIESEIDVLNAITLLETFVLERENN